VVQQHLHAKLTQKIIYSESRMTMIC